MKTFILFIWLNCPDVINVGPSRPEQVIVSRPQEAAIVMWEKQKGNLLFNCDYSGKLFECDTERKSCIEVPIPEVIFK